MSAQRLDRLLASAKRSLRQVPAARKARRRLQRAMARARHGRYVDLLQELSLFAPNSSGSHRMRADLTIVSAKQTFALLVELLRATGRTSFESVPAEAQATDDVSKRAAEDLKVLFDKYGSDKARTHNYHWIYGTALRNRDSAKAILEIGLGTNNPHVVSNMKGKGAPGSSLRALRDFLPNANVFGADVDRGVLFEEDRIRTFFVDQTDLATFSTLGHNIDKDLDLIIDDGLHAPNANLAVLVFGLERLKVGGWLVVEDISASAIPLWQTVASLLPPRYKPQLIDAKGALVFAIEKVA